MKFPGWLEIDLAAELHDARVEGRGELTKFGVTNGGIDVLELSVVPSVKGLDAQFKAAAARLAEGDALEEREVPVIATRAGEAVVGESAPRTVGRIGE